MNRAQFLNNIFSGVAAVAIMPAFLFCSSDSSGNKIPGNFNVNPDFSPDVDVEFQSISSIPESEAVNAASPCQFRFFNQRMQWVINGETFEMKGVAGWEKVQLNTTEIREFINGDDGRGMGMMQDMNRMPHPVHLHGLQFQIIERDVSQMKRDVWETVKDGFIK